MLINCVLSGPELHHMVVHICQWQLVAAPLDCWAAVPVCLSILIYGLYKPRFDKRESKLKYLCVFVCLFSIFLSFTGKKGFRYMEYMVKVDLLRISTPVWSTVIHILGHQHTFLSRSLLYILWKEVEKKRTPIGGLEHPNKESYPVFFFYSF